MRATIFNWLKWPAAISAASLLALSTSPAKDATFAGAKHAGSGANGSGLAERVGFEPTNTR